MILALVLLVLLLSLLMPPLLAPWPAQAQALVADISNPLIAIRTDFTGEEVVLFGSTDGPGDVVIVIEGPAKDVIIRQQEPMAGIWINTRAVRFRDVPSYYAVAATRDLAEIAAPEVLARHRIGVQHLGLTAEEPASAEELSPFRSALIRAKAEQELYAADPLEAFFLGQRLFRTTFAFPASVPTGLYNVHVYLFREGELIDAAQPTTLVISKVGFSADVDALAEEQAPLYALIALLGAVAAGWAAGFIFRKT